MSIRVLVCGGRNYGNYGDAKRMFSLLDRCHAEKTISCIIHGAAAGADSLASRWAKQSGVPWTAFMADWKTHGKAAGAIRNQQMLDEGKPDLVIAFPGGRGTADMVRRAKRAGVRVVELKA